MLGAVPDRIAADALRRPVGEFDLDIVEAEVAVHREQQLADRDRLAGDLILGAEDVRVVLGEAAHPHDAVQGPGRLVAVTAAKLGEAQRQVRDSSAAGCGTSAHAPDSSSA